MHPSIQPPPPPPHTSLARFSCRPLLFPHFPRHLNSPGRRIDRARPCRDRAEPRLHKAARWKAGSRPHPGEAR
eukprot:1132923-Pyramimonas_sp.AAC.1